MAAVGILSYGAGNVGSLRNMFARLDIESELVSDPDAIHKQQRLVLPGVGAYDHAMSELENRSLTEPLIAFARSGRPMLGVCLGMQLLLDSSEEGQRPGLGLIAGDCRRFRPPGDSGLRVPHMGWNTVVPTGPSQALSGLETENRFYFVHSYHAVCADEGSVLSRTTYGYEFASMIASDNVIGAQFHPEKSHRFGMTLLDNWART
jgi:glutamine amidotransferase